MAQEQNFLLYIEKCTDYDGVYWDDMFDILGLSAPIGVIFNSRVHNFRKSLISWHDVDELTEDSI